MYSYAFRKRYAAEDGPLISWKGPGGTKLSARNELVKIIDTFSVILLRIGRFKGRSEAFTRSAGTGDYCPGYFLAIGIARLLLLSMSAVLPERT